MREPEDIAASLRQRIRIEQPDLTPQEGGQFAVTWQEVATVWAKVLPLETRARSAEAVIDGQLVSPVSHEITLRYRAGISAEMRLVMGARIFDIRHVVNVGEQGRLLRLLAEERLRS